MKAAVSRVFSPGTGATPPALTGREREQAVLTQCLADLLGGASPPHDVVMVGPRGNGKTVLLNWFERACRDHDAEVAVVTLTPNDIPWAPPSSGARNLRTELAARCRRKPLAVLIDEAHTLDLEVGRTLLNVSQRVREEAPFLLVMVGTPGLSSHLGAMDASFLNRLGYIWSPPGQLPPVVWVAGIPVADDPCARPLPVRSARGSRLGFDEGMRTAQAAWYARGS